MKQPGNLTSPLTANEFCNSFPIFLGVRYDRQLTFAEHVQKFHQWMSGCFNFLRALGDTTWGCHTSDCHQVYIAIVRSMPKYAAAVWAPQTHTPVSYLHQQTRESSVGGGQSHHRPRPIYLAESQRHKRKDRQSTQFLYFNQLGLNPQVLAQKPSSEQLSTPPRVSPYPDIHHTS